MSRLLSMPRRSPGARCTSPTRAAVGAAGAAAALGVWGGRPTLGQGAAALLLAGAVAALTRSRAAALGALAGSALLVVGGALHQPGALQAEFAAAVVWGAVASAALALVEHDAGAAEAGLAADGAADRSRQRARAALRALAFAGLLAGLLGGWGRWMASGGGPFGGSRALTALGASPTVMGPYRYAASLDTGRRLELGDNVVMRVTAERGDYWRGLTYDRWDGRSWRRSDQRVVATLPGGGPASAPWAGVAGVADLAKLAETRVQVLAGGSDLLFAPADAVVFAAPGAEVRLSADGAARAERALGPGARYTVWSRPRSTSAEALRQADPLAADRTAQSPRPPATPISRRAAALAAAVTADAPTTYDKVRALEAWLGAHTEYSLDIPPLPPGADAVDQHLFVDRRGYCEQIATTLAVLLRSLGVPTRLGVGYVPGQRDGREWLVRAKDAHAWVEVYFPGVGWQPFDPTASVPLAPGAQATAPPPTGVGRRTWLLPAAAVALAGSALLGAAALGAGARAGRPRRRPRSWGEATVRRLERLGARAGRPRGAHETVAEYGAALAGLLGAAELAAVGDALSRDAFGEPLDPTTRRRVEEWIEGAARNRRRSVTTL